MQLPVTSITAAVTAFLLLILAILTVRRRLQIKAAFGDAGDQTLISAMRSHGNLAEHAPIILIMLALLENAKANATILATIAAIFVLGRVAHAIGLHQASEPGKAPLARQIGVIATWITMAVLAILLLIGVFQLG